MRRLFQLCTNICVSSQDAENLGISSDKVMSLDELNAAMIKIFAKQLNVVQHDLDEARMEIPLCDKKKVVSGQLYNYLL